MAQQADVTDVFGFVAHVLLPLLVCFVSLNMKFHYSIRLIIHDVQRIGNKNLWTIMASADFPPPRGNKKSAGAGTG